MNDTLMIKREWLLHLKDKLVDNLQKEIVLRKDMAKVEAEIKELEDPKDKVATDIDTEDDGTFDERRDNDLCCGRLSE